MAKPVQFKLLRYALVPYAQMHIMEPELPTPKGRVVEKAIGLDGPPIIFNYWGRPFAFVGFSYTPDNRFLSGTLAKKKSTDIGQLREREVVEVTTDDWIPVWVVIDVQEQYIAVEINQRFGQLDHVTQAIQAGLDEPIAAEYRQDVVVSAVTDARRFWEIVEEYPLVYRASFRLVSPNFLDTPRSVRELLSGWKGIFNQTAATVELKNDEGALQVPQEELGDAVEYVASGEGTWALEVAETPVDPHRVFSSADSTETFYVEIPRASRPPSELAKAPEAERTLLERFIDMLRRRNAA